MSRRLLNLGLIILLGPFLVTFAYRGVLFLLEVFRWETTMWFLIGAGASLLVYFVLLNGKIAFLEHLLHELEHAALAFLFSFQLPSKMEIDPTGSKVAVPAGGGCLTTLAPYYFPLLTMPFLILKALAALAFSLLEISFPTFLAVTLDLLIGATLMFHYVCSIKEYRLAQPDIKEVGFIPSFAVMLFLNLAFLIVSIVVVTGSYADLWAYIKTAALATVDGYKVAYAWVTTRLLPFLGDLIQSLLGRYCETCTPTPMPE